VKVQLSVHRPWQRDALLQVARHPDGWQSKSHAFTWRHTHSPSEQKSSWSSDWQPSTKKVMLTATMVMRRSMGALSIIYRLNGGSPSDSRSRVATYGAQGSASRTSHGQAPRRVLTISPLRLCVRPPL
jgi:hypothetical protein